jgi:voltage-gated potassium channel
MHSNPQTNASGDALYRQTTQAPGALQHSTIELLMALGLLFVFTPFVEDLSQGDMLEAMLLTLVMVLAVFVVRGGRTTWVIALLLLAPALTGKWLNHFRPDLLHPAIFLVASVIFFAFVMARLLLFIVRAPRVDTNVLCAGVSGFLILGLLWTSLYLTVARLNPNAFTLPSGPGLPNTLDGFSAFYFSFITLCTVGYGDIAPVSNVARMLAMTESITGLFYMAVLISRLVSMYSNHPQAASAEVTGKS